MKKLFVAAALAAASTLASAADIVDTAASAGQFNTLVQAVKAAGLVDTLKGEGPFTVEVTLHFRAYPPYLLRAFIDYEREMRPSAPLVDERVLERLDIVDLATATEVIP